MCMAGDTLSKTILSSLKNSPCWWSLLIRPFPHHLEVTSPQQRG